MKTLLCVEDQLDILDNNRRFLAGHGYNVLTAENLGQAREQLSKINPDAIILDIMLPDGLGLDLLTELREQNNQIPILMLTAWGKSSDVAKGLRMGANDYIAKPFEYEVLLARIEAMFRNVEKVPETITKGALKLNITAMAAYFGRNDMLLTQKEFSLLLVFIQNEDRVIGIEYLYEKIWGTLSGLNKRVLRQHISNLRNHLENNNTGYTIRAAYGEGYTFEKV